MGTIDPNSLPDLTGLAMCAYKAILKWQEEKEMCPGDASPTKAQTKKINLIITHRREKAND